MGARLEPGEHLAIRPRVVGKLTTQMFEQFHDFDNLISTSRKISAT